MTRTSVSRPGGRRASSAPRARGGATPAGRHLVVVGAGGNIGSHLVPHLGRMAGVGRVTLIDRDRYTRANLAAQDALPCDVGHSKAQVQARRLERIAPRLAVEAVPAAIEDLPPGQLRGDVILACLDSRSARQRVNETAWHLGVPWIDSGVAVLGAAGLLARVTVYVPGPVEPCLECAWDDRDYERLEQTYACGAATEPPPTGAPSSLGALAASLQALECQALLGGEPDRAGRQVVFDAAHASVVVTRFRHRSGCRMSDHAPWEITPIPAATLAMRTGEALAGLVSGNRASLAVEGRQFERRLVCSGCGRTRPCLRLRPARPAASRCGRCGRAMEASGFDLTERLGADELSGAAGACFLSQLGIRVGDVLRVSAAGGDRRFEITDRRPVRRTQGGPE